MQKRLHLLVALLAFMVSTAMAQITTSGISGKITSNGEEVIGATVTAIHQPSGTVYRAVTNIDGRYTIQGMRPGGPYKVEISYVGYKEKTFNNVKLSLGESENLSCSLQEDAHLLQEVVVSGKAGLAASRTGAATSMTAAQINDMPSITHGIADVARLNPQLTVTNSGTMSFAGTNNRYNNFMIDGAANNDVFGLASSGNNGGQAGTQPVSMETIEQIQVSVAPFDVRQSGFTGGAINAITKSGTNQFHGSAFYYGYNQNLIGSKYPYADGTGYAPKYQKQDEYNVGITLGGPIVKNKLFFFANYEHTNKQYPNLYGIDSGNSKVNTDQAKEILRMLQEIGQKQGYDFTDTFSNQDIYTKSDKAGLKLDWNMNEFNKFSVRWSLVSAEQLSGGGSSTSLNSYAYSYPFKSTTNSFIAELQSRISPSVSNEARASYVRVRDSRDIKANLPMITVSNVGSGSVNFGTERNSQANYLNQDIYTFEDNLTWLRGNHTFIFGTHNEIYHFKNMFISDKFGSYTFNGFDNFKNYYDAIMSSDPTVNATAGQYINQFRYGHANADVTGTENWASEFSAGQFGFYAQDKWAATNNFTLTYGLRLDIPVFFDTPAENATFNDLAVEKGWDLKTNRSLSFSPMLSPRVGFRWDINNDRKFILRGGVGVFTGRIPFVWVSNNFSGTGLQLSSYDSNNMSAADKKKLQLMLDPTKQNVNEQLMSASSGSQDVAVCEKNFKFAQNLRLNLGFDFNLLGIDWTAEAIYSKTLNDILYKNLAQEMTGETFGQKYGYEWDNRPLYQSAVKGTPIAGVYTLGNTSKGYTVNLSMKAEKHFDFGLDLMASYTWTRSRSVANGGSSVAKSNWTYQYTYRDCNNLELGNSAYNVPHRIQASAYYHVQYGHQKQWQTTIGLIYQGKSGSPYSYYYYGDVNEDGSRGNDLMFIPTDEQIDKMKFKAKTNVNNLFVRKVFGDDFDGNLTEDKQRTLLKAWIEGDSYLSKHRGEYYERYADNLPFEHHFDVHFGQKFSFKVAGQINSIELTFDILNVGNLLNKDWGHTYGDGFGSYYSPVTYSGNGEYQFDGSYAYKSYSDYYSRWRGQIGLKYTF